MSIPFLAEIRLFAGDFAPKGWSLCNGRLLPIAQYSTLFSLLGTSFGGDGKTTFALPDMQNNAPMHWGDGPGLTERSIGETNGQSTVTLTLAEMPQHSHGVNASLSSGSALTPSANMLADAALYTAPPFPEAMAPQAIAMSGSSQPHYNMQPYLGLTFIIALEGIYPARG